MSIILHFYSPILVQIRQRRRELCAIFQKSKGDLMSCLQGKLPDRVMLKLVYTWSNYHSAYLLWFERNHSNGHGVITKKPTMSKNHMIKILVLLTAPTRQIANGIS